MDELTGQGDTVPVRWTGQGTHIGPLQTPTGKRVTFTATDTIRAAGGKIVEDHSGFDIPGLLRQLGVTMPS